MFEALDVRQRWPGVPKCRGIDPDIFYPETKGGAAKAKGICDGCPCLELALHLRERDGIWGGQTAEERRKMWGYERPWATWLRHTIADTGLSQAEAARVLGVTASAVSHWCLGDREPLAGLRCHVEMALADHVMLHL